MIASLERRLKALEDAAGKECPRCSELVVVYLGDELFSASRYGKPISREEYLAHEAEDGPDGECAVCRQRPVDVKAGGEVLEVTGGGGRR